MERHTQLSVRMRGEDEAVHLCREHGEAAGQNFGCCYGQVWKVTPTRPGHAVLEVHAGASCGGCSEPTRVTGICVRLCILSELLAVVQPLDESLGCFYLCQLLLPQLRPCSGSPPVWRAQKPLQSLDTSLMPRHCVELDVIGKVAPGVRRFGKHAARSEEGHNVWGYAA